MSSLTTSSVASLALYNRANSTTWKTNKLHIIERSLVALCRFLLSYGHCWSNNRDEEHFASPLNARTPCGFVRPNTSTISTNSPTTGFCVYKKLHRNAKPDSTNSRTHTHARARKTFRDIFNESFGKPKTSSLSRNNAQSR